MLRQQIEKASTTSPMSTPRYAGLSLATGLAYWRKLSSEEDCGRRSMSRYFNGSRADPRRDNPRASLRGVDESPGGPST